MGSHQANQPTFCRVSTPIMENYFRERPAATAELPHTSESAHSPNGTESSSSTLEPDSLEPKARRLGATAPCPTDINPCVAALGVLLMILMGLFYLFWRRTALPRREFHIRRKDAPPSRDELLLEVLTRRSP